MAYLLAVLASIIYGSADFLGGLASRRTSALLVVTVSQASGLAVVLGAIPFFRAAHVAASDIAWGVAAGAASALGLGLLYHALAIGVMSIVAPLTAIFAALVPFLVGIVQGERLTVMAMAGVAMALVAIFLVSQTHRDLESHVAHGRSIVVALSAGIALGFFLVALDSASDEAGLLPLILARSASIVLVLPIAIARGIRPQRESAAPMLAAGALDMVANILYVLAVSRGMLVIVATLVSLYPATTVVLARLVYRERLRVAQQLGVILAIAAVALIVAG
ncbi:MAG: EamA family transporter [Acidobacteria bacterium]|nr:EamA family transporter [Acidobacteriota bacterium]